MKKLVLIPLLLISCTQGESIVKQSSQSFLFTQPAFSNLAQHLSFWHDSWFDIEKKSAFQVSWSYQHSFNSNKLKQYFLMADRESLKVHGSAHANYGVLTTDVRAEWLGLPNDFQGTLVIAPEQWQMCWNISMRRSLPKLFDSSFFDRMWAFVDLPVTMVHNNLNFKQEAVTGAGAATATVHDIETAFQNPDWNYQKMKTTSNSKTGLGHVRVGFGKTFISEGKMHVASYSALSIPTAKKQTNKYLFQPQNGLNGHVAMVWGASLQFPLTGNDNPNASCVFLEFENNYLIRNDQYRSFDLKNKEWSRFLLLRQKDQTTNTTTPGVNILTQSVRVSPYAIIDVSGGLRFNIGVSQAEIGFGVWGHNKERVRLNNAWQETYGIAGTTTNTSASASTIKTLGADDATFTAIKETDIDFNSGSSPATVLYRGHIAIGARGRGENADALFGCGAFVMIPRNRTKMLSQWGVWIKTGGAF